MQYAVRKKFHQEIKLISLPSMINELQVQGILINNTLSFKL
jgi:hypothetical protein